MKEDIFNTIIIVIVDLIAITLVYVCNYFTVPPIATLITVILTCVAGWGTYRIIKNWILKLFKKR